MDQMFQLKSLLKVTSLYIKLLSDESDTGPGFAATWMSKHLAGNSGRQRYAVCNLKRGIVVLFSGSAVR